MVPSSPFDQAALALHDTLVSTNDPLTLELSNEEFIPVINQSIQDSVSYYQGHNLYSRQDKNVDYYLGRQFDPQKTPTYQTPYVENVVYEAIRRIKPIAASRLPDLTVKPPSNGNEQSIAHARTLTDLFNTDINRRAMRKLIGLAHVHEQLYFFACVKARWNSELGNQGDKEFISVHPKNIVWDHHCKTNNADDMFFVAENAELTLKEILMMFPKKEAEFLAYLGVEPGKRQERLASRYKIWEVWFHWYKETKDKYGVSKWEKVQGVVWKYGTFVLGKMRNPYFDYEGKTHLFSRELRETKLPSEAEFYDMLYGDQETDTIYYNYFKNPRKPYFFMVYESLGDDPIDATNRVEQILYFQDHINQEGTQIIGMNERSAGKPLFNSDALDKETIQRLDWGNFKQAISVNGDDIGKAFTHVEMPPAPSQLYQSKQENRQIAFEMLGVNATTRGVDEPGDQTLGENQMHREQDYGFIDDLVEETINELGEWISQWSMQFIRVFYTREHLVDTVGKDGESLYAALTQDVVEDGMVVEVSASGVDKMLRKNMAAMNMKLGVGDLLSYYEDTEQSSPKERARRAFMMKASPQQYYVEFLAASDEQVAGPIQPTQDSSQTSSVPLPQPTPETVAQIGTQSPQPQMGQPPQAGMGGGGPDTPSFGGSPTIPQQASFNAGQAVGNGIKSLVQKFFPPKPEQPLVSPLPANQTMGTPTYGQPPTADQIRAKYGPGTHQVDPQEMAIVNGTQSSQVSPSPSPIATPSIRPSQSPLPAGSFDGASYATTHVRKAFAQPSPDVGQIIKQVFPGDANRAAVASFTESGYNPSATHVNRDGSVDTGLFQINSNTFKDFQRRYGPELKQQGISDYSQMTDPLLNARMAREIQQRQGWGAWYGPAWAGYDLKK